MADVTKVFPPFTLPENPQPSERYRTQFNKMAEAKKLGITWAKDVHNPLVVDADEIQLNTDAQRLYGIKQDVPAGFNNPLLAKDVRVILEAVETERLDRVEKSALVNKRRIYRGPLELLSPVEQKAVHLFADKVVPLVDEIESIQQDPHSPAHATYLAEYGDYYSKILFSRFHRDTCAGFDAFDPTCSLLPFFQDHPPINGMIDARISMQQFKELGEKLPAHAEELRPSTVLTVDARGAVKSTPLPQYAPVREAHTKLAEALQEIAGLTEKGQRLNPILQDQLRAWAQFFVTGSAGDEKNAVQATIDAGEPNSGLLRVHVGPSESYWDDNTKFPYVLQVGIRDPQVMKSLQESGNVFAKLESVAIPNYKPRQLSLRGGFADPMYHVVTAGFVKTFALCEPAGNNFPNYDYGTEGSNRFIWLDALATGGPNLHKGMEDLLDEDLSGVDIVKSFIEFVVDHESGHLLGPQRNHVTPNGKRMGAVFGEHWGSADEPKSDLTEAEKVKILLEGKVITWPSAVTKLRPMVVSSLMKSRKNKEAFLAGKVRDHTFGTLMEAAYFFKAGAFTMVDTPKGRRVHIDYQKALSSALELRKAIMTFQANGDLNGYLAFARDVVSTLPDEADQLINKVANQFPLTFIERHL